MACSAFEIFVCTIKQILKISTLLSISCAFTFPQDATCFYEPKIWNMGKVYHRMIN